MDAPQITKKCTRSCRPAAFCNQRHRRQPGDFGRYVPKETSVSLNVKEYFDDSASITDPVERAQAIGDFCFDAEKCAAEGDTATAIEMFELILTLDRYDDLLLHCIQTAEQQLIQLGARQLPSIESVIEDLTARFQKLPEYERNMALAKTLHRDMSDNADALARARQFLASAEAIRPLSTKDLRFKAELDSQ